MCFLPLLDCLTFLAVCISFRMFKPMQKMIYQERKKFLELCSNMFNSLFRLDWNFTRTDIFTSAFSFALKHMLIRMCLTDELMSSVYTFPMQKLYVLNVAKYISQVADSILNLQICFAYIRKSSSLIIYF